MQTNDKFFVTFNVQYFPDNFCGTIENMPDYVLSKIEDMINEERRFRNHVRFISSPASALNQNETKD